MMYPRDSDRLRLDSEGDDGGEEMLLLSEGVGESGGEAPMSGFGRRKTRDDDVAKIRCAA